MQKIIFVLCILVFGCLNQGKEVSEAGAEYFVVPKDGSCPEKNKSLKHVCQLIETPSPDYCNELPRRRHGIEETAVNSFDQIDCLITLAAYKKSEQPCRFLVGEDELICTAVANEFSSGCNALGDMKLKNKCVGYVEQVRVYDRLDKLLAYRH
ncbi:MAG: hypothetical protein GF334_08340 [Candidatus Altiarchaeales archaeon]|nr:hypothetical protein [Candidatus Altiarchaeales archaeon]